MKVVLLYVYMDLLGSKMTAIGFHTFWDMVRDNRSTLRGEIGGWNTVAQRYLCHASIRVARVWKNKVRIVNIHPTCAEFIRLEPPMKYNPLPLRLAELQGVFWVRRGLFCLFFCGLKSLWLLYAKVLLLHTCNIVYQSCFAILLPNIPEILTYIGVLVSKFHDFQKPKNICQEGLPYVSLCMFSRKVRVL